MAIPFQPLTTEKLESFFKRMIESNYHGQDSNSSRERPTGKIRRNKPRCSPRILKTWMQRQIKS